MNQRANKTNKETSGKEIGNSEFAFTLPQNIELEKAVLGVILLETSAWDVAVDILRSECFYEPVNRIVWEICDTIYKKGYNIDLLTVTDELRKINKLDEVGGAYYLTSLTMGVVNGAHLHQWCLSIFEKFQHREMIRMCQETIAASHQENDIFEVLEEHEKKLTNIMLGNTQTTIQTTKDLLMALDQDLERMEQKENKVIGLATGFPQFDALLSGFKPGELIILAARPSIGKSALAMNFGVNVEQENKIGVQVFSLEMPSKEYMARMVSSISKVQFETILRGKMTPADKILYRKAADEIAKKKILFDETPGINISQLKSISRRLAVQGEIGFIIIDYLQLMGTLPGMRFQTRDAEIGHTSKSLKELAKELHVPILALCQLNREVEKRAKQKPIMSDLRESGNLEQDADVIIFMSPSEMPGFVDFHIAKNRNGKKEEFQLMVDFEIQTFFHRDTWIEHSGGKPNKSDQFRMPTKSDEPDDLPF